MAANPCYGLLWIIILFVFAYPIGLVVTIIWFILQPFEACFRFIKDINDFLEGFTTWPRECGNAIQKCSSTCPTPV